MRLWPASFLIFVLCYALSAHAQLVANVSPSPAQVTAPIYTWQTKVGQNKAGKFEFCMVRNMLDNGLAIQLAANAKGQQHLTLEFPQNKLILTENYPLVWQVDNNPPEKLAARASNVQTLRIPLTAEHMNALANGQNLSLIGPTDRLDITLTGGQGAIMALQDCLQVHGGLETSPLPDDYEQTEAHTKTPQAKILAKTLPKIVAQRFENANLAPTQMVVVPASQRHKLPLDFAWDVRDLFVGYKAVKGELAEFAPFMQLYLQGLKTLCAGQIRAEVGEGLVNKQQKTAWQKVDIACDHQGQITVTALLFEHTHNQHHVFFVEAPANQGAQAFKARDKL